MLAVAVMRQNDDKFTVDEIWYEKDGKVKVAIEKDGKVINGPNYLYTNLDDVFMSNDRQSSHASFVDLELSQFGKLLGKESIPNSIISDYEPAGLQAMYDAAEADDLVQDYDFD